MTTETCSHLRVADTESFLLLHTHTHTDRRADSSMFVAAHTHTHYLHQFCWPPDAGAPPSSCIKPKPASLSERSCKFVTSGEKKPPQMTIKPDQYFMKMKCSGTVYSGRGAPGWRGGAAASEETDTELLSRRAFLYPTFLQGVAPERGPPGTPTQGSVRTARR